MEWKTSARDTVVKFGSLPMSGVWISGWFGSRNDVVGRDARRRNTTVSVTGCNVNLAEWQFPVVGITTWTEHGTCPGDLFMRNRRWSVVSSGKWYGGAWWYLSAWPAMIGFNGGGLSWRHVVIFVHFGQRCSASFLAVNCGKNGLFMAQKRITCGSKGDKFGIVTQCS